MTPFQEAVGNALGRKAQARFNARIRDLRGSTILFDAPREQNQNRHVHLIGPQHKQPQLLLPSLIGLLGTIGITGVAANVIAGIAISAISFGLQYLLTPKPPKPEDGRTPIQQSIPYINYGVGQSRWAGSFTLFDAKGPGLHMVQALMGHPVQGNATNDGYVEWWLNDDKVTPRATLQEDTHWIEALPYDGNRYSGGHVRVDWRLGATPETAYAFAVTKLSASGLWTTDCRGDGAASIYVYSGTGGQEDFSKHHPYGLEKASVVGQWAKCWDFRDPDQHPLDPSTWEWTTNPVVQMCWHLCFNPYGERRDFRRAILPVLDMWKEEADVCDEAVPLAIGGTEKRYEAAGVGSTEQPPKSFTNALLVAMDGWMCYRGDGAILIVAGKFREKYCVTLTDAEIIGYDFERGKLPSDEINRLTPRFNYPAIGYSTASTDFWEDTESQTLLGVLAQEADYQFVTKWRQARRLGKRDAIRLKEKVAGPLYINLAGINAAYAPFTRLNAPIMLPDFVNKVFMNRRSTIDIMSGGYQLQVSKMPDVPADIDAWDEATDEGDAPYVPPNLDPDVIPTPTIDSVVVISTGTSVSLRIALVDPNSEDLKPTIRWRTADVGSGAGEWTTIKFTDAEPSGGLIILDTPPVSSDVLLDVQAKFTGAKDKSGSYTTSTQILTTLNSNTPMALLDTSAVNGNNQYGARFTTDVDPNVSKVAVYKVPAGGTLNKVTHLVATPAVAPGVVYAPNYASGPGLFDLYYEPKNASNVAGPLAGPLEDVKVNFNDAFTRADQNLDASANWTRTGGASADVQIVSNEVHSVTVSNALWLSPDVGVADQFVQATFVAGATSSLTASVALRVTDINNMILFRRNASAQLVVQKRVGGTGTSLYTTARTPGDVVRLELVGNNLDVYVNGAHAAGPFSVSDVPASTRAGIWNNGLAAATPFIDDFLNGPLA